MSGGGTRSGAAVDDFVERRVFGPPVITISKLELDVRVAHSSKALSCLPPELFNDFHAVDLARELCQDRRLITEPRTNLENRVGGFEAKQIGHQRHDKR